MKKLYFLFSLILIIVFSCVQQDDNTSSAELISVEKALNNTNIDLSKYHNPIFLEGNIKVWINKNNELVAYTETDTHIHIFLLQYMKSNPNLKGNYNSISFLDHSFSLVAGSGKSLLCEVKDKGESRLAGNDIKQISGISNFETIVGGGVAHIWIVA